MRESRERVDAAVSEKRGGLELAQHERRGRSVSQEAGRPCSERGEVEQQQQQQWQRQWQQRSRGHSVQRRRPCGERRGKACGERQGSKSCEQMRRGGEGRRQETRRSEWTLGRKSCSERRKSRLSERRRRRRGSEGPLVGWHT
jgi:hypothetical protein